MTSISNQVGVTIVCPSPGDATSWYRGIGPWGDLKRALGEKLVAVFSKDISWTTFAMSDGLFLQRPFREDHLEMMSIARSYGAWTWIDYDDDLMAVPSHNPTYSIYGEKKTILNVMNCLVQADVVTVSTPFLKESFEREYEQIDPAGVKDFAKKIKVVRNALNHRTTPQLKKVRAGTNNLVLWRGSATHHMDISPVANEILRAAEENKNWTFNFIGDRPWFLADRTDPKQFIFSPALDIGEFHEHIFEISPKVMIVPLEKSRFNYSKSNIAWLEGTMAGAIVVAPDMPEWIDKPNVLNYSSAGEFRSALGAAMSMPDVDRHKMVYKGINRVLQSETLESRRPERIKILEELCKKNN